MVNVIDEKHGDWFSMYNADCVDFCRQVAAERPGSVDMILYSPPFANLYIYSASERDMGNCVDHAQFMQHYAYLLPHLYAMLRPGRLCVVHCKNIPLYQGKDGEQGIYDFRGDIIRAHKAAGFSLRSEHLIWKCPERERAKTNTRRLTWGTMQQDSSYSGAGLPEYLLAFARPAKEGDVEVPVSHEEGSFTLDEWRQFASPAWVMLEDAGNRRVQAATASTPDGRALLKAAADGEAFAVPTDDIDETDVLNVNIARSDKDEKHMCPLPLPIIKRAVRLWTNPGEVVFSPYGGVGSEGVGALSIRDATEARRPRRFFGCELKPEYFAQACKFLAQHEPEAKGQQVTLWDLLARDPVQAAEAARAKAPAKKGKAPKTRDNAETTAQAPDDTAAPTQAQPTKARKAKKAKQ